VLIRRAGGARDAVTAGAVICERARVSGCRTASVQRGRIRAGVQLAESLLRRARRGARGGLDGAPAAGGGGGREARRDPSSLVVGESGGARIKWMANRLLGHMNLESVMAEHGR
jgi:hypothetical protein